jgi:hypothetical protein
MALLAPINTIADGALAADGSLIRPFGKVPRRVTLQEAQHSAGLAIAVLASL